MVQTVTGINDFFAETSIHLFKNGHFKNVHFSKPNYYFFPDFLRGDFI